jgi:hypothetical protein
MAYYAVPMSGSAISAFRHYMIERWHGALMRRSQRRRLTWARMKTIADLANADGHSGFDPRRKSNKMSLDYFVGVQQG